MINSSHWLVWAGSMVVAACVVGIATGCNNSNDLFQGSAVVVPNNKTAQVPNLVKLTGVTIDADTVRVDVVITGATTSSDLYSFVFDIELADGTVAQYVAGSATFGDALQPGAGQGQSVLVTQNGNRVVVGISKTGGGAGNGVPLGNWTIASFQFHVPGPGATELKLTGTLLHTPPVVLDSTGAVIPSIRFDTEAATISR